MSDTPSESKVHFSDYKKEYPTKYSSQYERPELGGTFFSQARPSNSSQSPQNSEPRSRSSAKYDLQSPRDKNFFFNAVNASLSSILGSLLTYPFIKARSMLSISPEMPTNERMMRYTRGLPQLIAQNGVMTLFKGYDTYAVMVPALTLDLAFFYFLKSVIYPRRYFREADLPWFANSSLAGIATIMRYVIYQPFADAHTRVTSYTSSLKGSELLKEMNVSMQNTVKNKGIGGLYEGFLKNIPGLVVFRAMQLGTLETLFQRLRYQNGHTSLFKKFIICYGVTVISKYVSYPFDLARQLIVTDGLENSEVVKKYVKIMKEMFGRNNFLDHYKKATTRAFQASGSTLALCIFFHLNDDVQKAD